MRNLYSSFRVLPTFNFSRLSALNKGATSALKSNYVMPLTIYRIDAVTIFANHPFAVFPAVRLLLSCSA
jgi:hypothetical protein